MAYHVIVLVLLKCSGHWKNTTSARRFIKDIDIIDIHVQ